MQMTHTLKALAAAVSMTLALSAQAAPISSDQINFGSNVGGGTGAGSLVLAMVDAANGKSLVFNTGLTVASFNAQSTTSFDVSIAAADRSSSRCRTGQPPTLKSTELKPAAAPARRGCRTSQTGCGETSCASPW